MASKKHAPEQPALLGGGGATNINEVARAESVARGKVFLVKFGVAPTLAGGQQTAFVRAPADEAWEVMRSEVGIKDDSAKVIHFSARRSWRSDLVLGGHMAGASGLDSESTIDRSLFAGMGVERWREASVASSAGAQPTFGDEFVPPQPVRLEPGEAWGWYVLPGVGGATAWVGLTARRVA